MDFLGLGRGAKGRPRAVLCWTAILVASVGVGVPSASGQSRLGFGDGSLFCTDLGTCETATDCDGSDTCTFVAGFDGMYCLTADGTSRDLFCCDPDAAVPCPDLGSGHGTCTSVVSDLSLCVYPDDSRELCLESDTGDARLSTLRACFSDAATGAATRDWATGDCDDDGIKNAAEIEGCVCDSEESCGEVDAGVPDAGPGEEDAGPGEEEDAGPEREDAGPPNRDAAAPEMDAGSIGEGDPLNGIDFRGSGGCSCDSGGGSGFPPAAAIAVIVGAALARRRRRPR